jgi:hypothetical protein
MKLFPRGRQGTAAQGGRFRAAPLRGRRDRDQAHFGATASTAARAAQRSAGVNAETPTRAGPGSAAIA